MLRYVLIILLVLMLVSFFGGVSGLVPHQYGYGGGGISLLLILVVLALLYR